MRASKEQNQSAEDKKASATREALEHFGSRSSFANTWTPGRLRKVAPIEAVFRRNHTLRPDMERLLDIGAGAGLIGDAVATKLEVSCIQVDAQDQRVVQGPPFFLALGECLPFKDETFDLVIANHVIEHVGDQLVFLQEIRRVLKPGGCCYVATPNKYALIEPHYKLPHLSWFPRPVADLMVRLSRKGKAYDVQPLTRKAFQRLGKQAGLRANDLTEELVRQPRLYGRADGGAQAVSVLPSLVIRALLAIVPTHVWLLSKPPVKESMA